MIRRITALETIPVRWPILRPGFPRETAVFAGDELPTTQHFGAFSEDGTLIGVASIYLAPLPDAPPEIAVPAEKSWQLRGMATLPEVRGAGHGCALVEACVQAARAAGAELLWCNARTTAAPFYAKNGWQITGQEFDIPTVGPHFRMWRRV